MKKCMSCGGAMKKGGAVKAKRSSSKIVGMPGYNAKTNTMKSGGTKKKSSFPDLTGDGKVTRADIIKGRGVIKKKGGAVKKKK
jgi:hypothetical protein